MQKERPSPPPTHLMNSHTLLRKSCTQRNRSNNRPGRFVRFGPFVNRTGGERESLRTGARVARDVFVLDRHSWIVLMLRVASEICGDAMVVADVEMLPRRRSEAIYVQVELKGAFVSKICDGLQIAK